MIRLAQDAQGRVEIAAGGVRLLGCAPAVNGQSLTGWEVHSSASGDAWQVEFTAPALQGGRFVLSARAADDWAALEWALRGVPAGFVLDSFGLFFERIENLGVLLRQGAMSWDGSQYAPPGSLDDGPMTGYAITQLLPASGTENLVLGFDRHDRFLHSFTFKAGSEGVAMLAQTLWDRRDHSGWCEGDRLVVLAQTGVEEGLRRWARVAASAAPIPPRLPDPPITGWSSWYNLYAAITEDNIREHLHAAAEVVRRENLPMRVFQIDDGFTPEMGDWLAVRPTFLSGMKALLAEIRLAGFVPGLWIAPFMVGNRSQLFRQHPDWVVQDAVTGEPLVQAVFYGEFRWHKRSEEYYILDATHPDALDYLERVFRAWHEDWGCAYFKTDFMHYGMAHGPDRARHYRSGMTRVEIFRQALERIRAAIGNSLWLGSGCPLFAPIGLIDAMRIGRDVGVRWTGEYSAQSLLRDQANRNFANGILWQSDPDAVLLRERFHHLTDEEVRSLALYAGMTGGVLMTSDHLGELSDERLALWKLILSAAGRPCDFPLLGRTDDPIVVQVRRPERAGGLAAVFCLNLSETHQERVFSLEELGFSMPQFVWVWPREKGHGKSVDRVGVFLPPHGGQLFYLQSQPFDAAPEGLP